MTDDEAPSPEARAIVEQGMSALADVLRQLEPVAGPVDVTRFHSPPQDRCDDPTCPCELPPSGAAPVALTDSGDGVAGWADGRTSALICWRGWDGPVRPEDPGLIETWTRTTTDEHDVVMTLASIDDHQDNTELVGAWLLPGPAEAAEAAAGR